MDDKKNTTEGEQPANGQSGQGSELAQLQADLAAMTETAKRALADLQNFKRRAEEERGEIQVFANIRLLEALFPALDNFARAFANVPEELKNKEWVKGMEAIEENLMKALITLGLEVIDQTNVPADPHRHEILIEEEGKPGSVIKVFEKGYAFKGKTLRPAKVSVGGKKSE